MSTELNVTEFELLQNNPLLKDWSHKQYGFPPFNELKAEYFEPALQHSMKLHLKEIEEIVANPVSATFDNVIAPLDRSGQLFNKISDTLDNLCSSLGTPDYQAIELKMAGPLASHFNNIATFPGLFEKIDSIYQQRHNEMLSLNPEQIRVLERFHLDLLRQGAKFNKDMQTKYSLIIQELAELSTKFSQHVTIDVNEIYLELYKPEDFDGLPEDLISASKQASNERNLSALPGKEHILGIITLSRSLVEPFLTYSSRRDLREKVWKLWSKRGEGIADANRNNLVLAKRILQLREEKAKMHGYQSFAEFATADTMAGGPQKVLNLLEEVWEKAKVSVEKERKELLSYIANNQSASDEKIHDIEPWDWRYYAEKVRIANYNLDTNELKPYFPLNRMTEAIFDVAKHLFGLSFVENQAMPKYHPDIKIYEVFNKDNQLTALFIHDNYARPYKRGGAWMSSYRSQHRNTPQGTSVIPIIVNNNNFNKPLSENAPTLLSYDDARTLFHEFGHGLHGMLSNVTYQRLAGTNVLKDFVELPSQLYEHWLSESKVLQQHAKHYQTNEIIPEALLTKLMKAQNFNQGFQTIEYTSSALVDTKLHLLSGSSVNDIDLQVFEKETLQSLQMPQGIIMRHRLPHFEHLFAGEGYASGYYVYLWAEVLDADGFEAFKETGDCFNPEVADRVYRYIYSAGNSQDPASLFRQFRGRDPIIEPMLKKRGLIKDN